MCNINNKSHTPPTLKNPGSFDTKIANKKKTYKVYCWMRSANLERNMTSTVKTDDAMHTVAFPKTRSKGGKNISFIFLPSSMCTCVPYINKLHDSKNPASCSRDYFQPFTEEKNNKATCVLPGCLLCVTG